jgi:hypothetical protein
MSLVYSALLLCAVPVHLSWKGENGRFPIQCGFFFFSIRTVSGPRHWLAFGCGTEHPVVAYKSNVRKKVLFRTLPCLQQDFLQLLGSRRMSFDGF